MRSAGVKKEVGGLVVVGAALRLVRGMVVGLRVG
jgi:hypothetical protein